MTSFKLLRSKADLKPGVLDIDPYSDVPPLPVLPVFTSMKCFLIDIISLDYLSLPGDDTVVSENK